MARPNALQPAKSSTFPLFDLQMPRRGEACTCTERAPMAADGSIRTSHWLFTGASRSLHVRDLVAKAIYLSSVRSPAATAQSLDNQRVVYGVEWQAQGSHTVPHARAHYVSCQRQPGPEICLTQADAQPECYALGLSSAEPAGTAFAACAAQTALLQTATAQAARRAAVQLVTWAGQSVARTPAGSRGSASASAAALGMQAMLRVGAQELASWQWAFTDVSLAHPQPLPRLAATNSTASLPPVALLLTFSLPPLPKQVLSFQHPAAVFSRGGWDRLVWPIYVCQCVDCTPPAFPRPNICFRGA